MMQSSLNRVLLLALCTSWLAVDAAAMTFSHNVSLIGDLRTTEISGYKGTGISRTAAADDHAMTGISSYENRDQPCKVVILTENVNDSAEDSETRVIDLCGANAEKNDMKAVYSDTGLNEQRVFVSAIRVCTNKKGNRVKGYQLKGRLVLDDGSYRDAAVGRIPRRFWNPAGMPVSQNNEVYPADFRFNCSKDDWLSWAECPSSNQLAVGAVLHFEAGNEPRALTGIALQCRALGRVPTKN